MQSLCYDLELNMSNGKSTSVLFCSVFKKGRFNDIEFKLYTRILDNNLLSPQPILHGLILVLTVRNTQRCINFIVYLDAYKKAYKHIF